LTNAAEAVGKTNNSIINFLRSNGFKALLGEAPELSIFTVENAQKPIVGIPHEIADEFWYDQLAKGNKRARSLSRAFGLPGFEKKRGRYLLSETNAAEAVGKDD
jgi:hypothetical protein